MKRLFNPKKKSESEPVVEQGTTLDRIVKDKEGVKKRLEEEEREFLYKKREYERKMIEMEKQEVHRREQEISEKNTELQELKRKNNLVQTKVEEQIQTLQSKLVELKTEHQSNEDNCQAVLASLKDMLQNVEQSLNQRLESYGNEREIDNFPSAPEDLEEISSTLDLGNSSHIYPSLNNMTRRSWHQVYSATNNFRDLSVNDDETDNKKDNTEGSLGSSPQISVYSNSSSTRNPQELDSDLSI